MVALAEMDLESVGPNGVRIAGPPNPTLEDLEAHARAEWRKLAAGSEVANLDAERSADPQWLAQ
jgi:hypothetical protein